CDDDGDMRFLAEAFGAMGIEVAPRHPLFTSNKSLAQLRSEYAEFPREGRRITFDRRKEERRVAERRAVSDRRSGERRLAALSWLGQERREANRRHSTRRKT
ncbi:hypothetical protein ACFL1S_09500, partial [Pseudomonadota bacterium]